MLLTSIIDASENILYGGKLFCERVVPPFLRWPMFPFELGVGRDRAQRRTVRNSRSFKINNHRVLAIYQNVARLSIEENTHIQLASLYNP